MSNASVWVITLCVLVVILLAVIVAEAYIIAWQAKQAAEITPPDLTLWVDADHEQL